MADLPRHAIQRHDFLVTVPFSSFVRRSMWRCVLPLSSAHAAEHLDGRPPLGNLPMLRASAPRLVDLLAVSRPTTLARIVESRTIVSSSASAPTACA